MSYALESKKRKFHRVLDSISSGTPSKPSTAESSVDHQSARPSTPLSTASPTIKRVRLSPRSERDGVVIRDSPGLSKRPSETSLSSRPNFVPWDRSRFLARLQTFRKVDWWSPKPPAINEVQWARKGWSCTGAMRVECVGGCGQSLIVKLPDEIEDLEEYDSDKLEERKEVRASLVEKYSALISDGHAEKCPWRKAGCDNTIQRLPLSKPENALQGLRARYTNLASLGALLPETESLELPEELDISGLLEIIPSGVLGTAEEEGERPTTDSEAIQSNGTQESAKHSNDTINKAALSLALFGWDVSDAGAGLVSCGACFRRLGLWMYKPKSDGKPSVYSRLDVASEHLDYCPWINAETQSGHRKAATGVEAGRSGWQELERAIRTTHRRQTCSDASSMNPGSEETTTMVPEEVDNEARKAKDKEWWAKLRRLRQSLHVKTPKRVQK